MNIDNFELILSNVNETKKYADKVNSKCELSTYHLITDNNNIQFEVEP